MGMSHDLTKHERGKWESLRHRVGGKRQVRNEDQRAVFAVGQNHESKAEILKIHIMFYVGLIIQNLVFNLGHYVCPQIGK